MYRTADIDCFKQKSENVSIPIQFCVPGWSVISNIFVPLGFREMSYELILSLLPILTFIRYQEVSVFVLIDVLVEIDID